MYKDVYIPKYTECTERKYSEALAEGADILPWLWGWNTQIFRLTTSDAGLKWK